MGILDNASETYARWTTIVMIFSIFLTLVVEGLGYGLGTSLYPSDMGVFNWGTSTIQNAINNLQSAEGINVIVAVPQLLAGILQLLVRFLLNSILLINWIISKLISIICMLVVYDADTIATISSMLSWVLTVPIVIGLVVELGKLIYSFLPISK